MVMVFPFDIADGSGQSSGPKIKSKPHLLSVRGCDAPAVADFRQSPIEFRGVETVRQLGDLFNRKIVQFVGRAVGSCNVKISISSEINPAEASCWACSDSFSSTSPSTNSPSRTSSSSITVIMASLGRSLHIWVSADLTRYCCCRSVVPKAPTTLCHFCATSLRDAGSRRAFGGRSRTV